MTLPERIHFKYDYKGKYIFTLGGRADGNSRFDYTIWNNRVNGSFEYFNRVSDNLIFSVPLPLSSGFASTTRNVGSMYNRGFEIAINADVIRTKDVTWNIGFNATTFKNQITKLPQTEIISGTKKLMVGRSINDYWLRQWYGVDATDGAGLYLANPGTAVRITGKGDSVVLNPTNAKFDYSGSAIPDWYGGFTTSFRYRNLTLSTLINWQIGGLTYDDTYAAYMHSGTYGASLHTDMLQRWQKPGDITTVPRMDNAQTSFFGATRDRWLTDASFLNIQNITFAWDFKGREFIATFSFCIPMDQNTGRSRFVRSIMKKILTHSHIHHIYHIPISPCSCHPDRSIYTAPMSQWTLKQQQHK